ncbi:MAG: hypothetical protein V1802_03505 [Candidatus Aenigmatarchaeota archaeon]
MQYKSVLVPLFLLMFGCSTKHGIENRKIKHIESLCGTRTASGFVQYNEDKYVDGRVPTIRIYTDSTEVSELDENLKHDGKLDSFVSFSKDNHCTEIMILDNYPGTDITVAGKNTTIRTSRNELMGIYLQKDFEFVKLDYQKQIGVKK